MAAKKLPVQLLEVLMEIENNPESNELIIKRDELVKRINKQASEAEVGFEDFVNGVLKEEKHEQIEEFDFDIPEPIAKPKKEMARIKTGKGVNKKALITASDFKSENVFVEITDSPNFNPYTGEPMKGKVKKPFITSCHMQDYERFIRFHARRKGFITCIYAPKEVGGKDAMNELIKNKGKKKAKE